jgi:hypothetical protein
MTTRAKYPLAIIGMMLDSLGDNNVVAYDIGCGFDKTVTQSKLLGTRAAAQALTFIVPAFHGHAHNRACQLDYHPQYIANVGIEDFETCERCFSISNGLAPNTRLATQFHRRQAIEQHFQFQDEDKYADLSELALPTIVDLYLCNTGTFIVSNYNQALSIISTNTTILTKACSELNIIDSDFDRYLNEERVYLASLKTERLTNTLHLDYVKAINHHQLMVYVALCCSSLLF